MRLSDELIGMVPVPFKYLKSFSMLSSYTPVRPMVLPSASVGRPSVRVSIFCASQKEAENIRTQYVCVKAMFEQYGPVRYMAAAPNNNKDDWFYEALKIIECAQTF